MNKETPNYIKLGIFVVAGMLLVIVGLYFIGSNKNLFSSTFKLYTHFREVSGLQNGNNVRYSGIDIGTVSNIEIINDTSIRVELLIEEKMKSYIRLNSIAAIGTDGLMGNKLVNIEPGTGDASLTKEGDVIPSREGINTDVMLRTLDLTNRNIALVSGNLKEITENINSSRGTLYTVLMDTSLATGFHRTINNIESVSNNLTQIVGQLSSMVSEVKQGKGTVGMLLKDTIMKSDLQTIISEVKKSSEQFSAMTLEMGNMVNKINKGNGTISTLLNDTAMANHMKQSMTNIQSASKKLDEDLEAMKHSFLLKGYFKDEEKKAAKAKAK